MSPSVGDVIGAGLGIGAVGDALAGNYPQIPSDVRVEDFRIYGYKAAAEGRAAEIHELITEAEIRRTIDGAPTLTLEVHDAKRVLSQHNFLSYRITMVLDTFAFELAQIKKSGDSFTLVFEDVIVAEMRRANRPRKVGPGKMSRVEFGYLLLSELPAKDFVTPPIELFVTADELARGREIKPGEARSAREKPEDTWAALTRIFGEVNWRFWVDMGKVFAAPDSYLMTLPSAAVLQERVGGVDDIDYDIDSGKRVSKLTVSVLANRWALPIGSRVEVEDAGPSRGSWIVSEFRRSLFSKQATVTLVSPVKELKEPPHQPGAGDPQANYRPPAKVVAGQGASVGATAGSNGAEAAVQFALSKEGLPYIWGGTGPNGYDCSGLTQAAFATVGVSLPRVSWQQYDFCAARGGAISVEEAAHTRGALLEHPAKVTGPNDSGHIAISLGTGNDTIEAMGRAYGIRRGHIQGRYFSRGAKVPGIRY